MRVKKLLKQIIAILLIVVVLMQEIPINVVYATSNDMIDEVWDTIYEVLDDTEEVIEAKLDAYSHKS